MKKNWKVFISILFAVSVVFLSSCGPAETPTVEEAPEMPPPAASSKESSEDLAQDEEPAAEEAPEKEQEEEAQACLIGTWQTVPGSVSDYLLNAMNSTSEGGITFGIENEQGHLTLKFYEDGQVEGLAEEYQVTVTVEEIDTAVDVEIVLSGSAEYTADGNKLAFTDPNYDAEAVGEGIIAGMQTSEQAARIELTPGHFAAQSESMAFEGETDLEGSADYTCEGDSLVIEIPDLSAIEWERVE
jgi:hypothetical protein